MGTEETLKRELGMNQINRFKLYNARMSFFLAILSVAEPFF